MTGGHLAKPMAHRRPRLDKLTVINKLFAPTRQRALDADEKAARREAIVDATARLYDQNQDLPGVAEVAREAGLAKGTMYLYFESKEALYLALHARHSQAFFAALIDRLERPAPFDVDDMLAIVDEHMIRQASFLPLCNACMGAAPDSMDEATHEAFHGALGAALARAGEGLERRMPTLVPGDGMRFLHHGYALLLGLHQLLGQRSQCALRARLHAGLQAGLQAGLHALGLTPASPTQTPAGAPPGLGDFRSESHAALRGLWHQAQTQGLVPARPAAPMT